MQQDAAETDANDPPIQQNNRVRLVVISDTHTRHKALDKFLPPRDPNMRTILLHCGDFTDRGSSRGVRSFCRWLAHDGETHAEGRPDVGLPSHYDEVVVIDGNHDQTKPPQIPMDLTFEFEKCNKVLRQKGIKRRVHFLQDKVVMIAGVTFHGVSWRSVEADNFSAIIGNDGLLPDVVLAHIPPHHPRQEWSRVGRLRGTNLEAWKGSRTFANAVLPYKIPLVLSGHLHWGRGAVHVPTGDSGTWLVNAASTKPGVTSPSRETDPELEVTPPVVIEYDIRNQQVVGIHCPPH